MIQYLLALTKNIDLPWDKSFQVSSTMELTSALNFTLVGIALELLSRRNLSKKNRDQNSWYVQILALLATIVSFLVLVSYAYQVKRLDGTVAYASMALGTAVGFAVLCAGILSARADLGIMRLITQNTDESSLIRRLIVLTAVIPVGTGWLILKGYHTNRYEAEFAISLFVVTIVLVFTLLIWQCATHIERIIHQRDRPAGLVQSEQENEAKLKTLVGANIMGILFSDSNGAIEQANTEFLRIIGYKRSDISAGTINWQKLTPPEYLHLDRQRLIEARDKGVCTPYEKEFIRKDGTHIPVLINHVRQGTSQNKFVTFVLDLSEKKKAQATLKHRQKWLEDLLNLTPIPLLLIEPKTAKILFANQSAEKFAYNGFFNFNLNSKNTSEYYFTDIFGNSIPPEETPGFKIVNGKKLDGLEINWHTPEYTQSLMIYADTLPAIEGYNSTGVVFIQDITEFKQTEKALSLDDQKLKVLAETSSNLLFKQEPKEFINRLFFKLTQFIDLNAYFYYVVDDKSQVLRLLSHSGISTEIAEGIDKLPIDEGIYGTVAAEREAIVLDYLQISTETQTEELRKIGIKSGYIYPLIIQNKLLGILVLSSYSCSNFQPDELVMMQTVCDQITVAMERLQLINSHQQQIEQLKATNRFKDDFLAVLSHELRSPLNAILGWAQLLRSRQHLDPKKKAQALEIIERNAKTQTQLVEDLLDVSRALRGKLCLRVENCNLVVIIQRVVQTLSVAAQAKKIQVKTILEDDIRTIPGDSDRLEQIIWNLLSNAIKFTPQGGKVTIKLSQITASESLVMGQKNVQIHQEEELPVTEYIQIQVIDTGIGISPERLPHIFELFYQGDISISRSYGGLGLGLAIVRHLVELHGGIIDVESRSKIKGTIFSVKLPLLPRKKEQVNKRDKYITDRSLAVPHSKSSFVSSSLKELKVLVVDSESESRELIYAILRKSQAIVRTVDSVSEAVEILSHWQADVLLSDIKMIDGDGFTLLQKLRDRKLTGNDFPEGPVVSNIPAAALTMSCKTEDRIRALEEGYQLHLPKPVNPTELAMVVANLSQRVKNK
ncbi:hypothetical protein BC008_28750 [Mastigocoleus testarum BC008]|uniref:Circadian input-output histidine kinase CikA n=2 Tax=Mastigocoleus TaxID=996924 RepID=A0A0V7ZS26_9CYAN|nr:hypothetical protein BC008_27425 [Mastigocoleus testarum BC008]KST67186.1 hypothetical protein BC008_28750 [Mastigocoleus testarum BC008]